MSFQRRVEPWLLACFGEAIAADSVERNHRFLEEALELVQACGCTASEAHQLVDYVYGRPIGEKWQEAGGVMVTLAALCRAQGIDMHEAGEVELARIWTMVEKIRAKQAAKPKHSPLPEAPTGHDCPDSPGICECFPRGVTASQPPHSWHDYGQTPGGQNRVRCLRCGANALAGEEEAAPPCTYGVPVPGQQTFCGKTPMGGKDEQ